MSLRQDRGSLVVILLALVIFLAFFRGLYALGIYGGGDDACYAEWLSRLMFSDFASCKKNMYAPGVALTWLPGGVLAAVAAWIGGLNIHGAITASIGISSYACWAIALWLVYSIVRKYGVFKNNKIEVLVSIAFMLNIPVLYYATNRTSMGHAGEIMVGMLFFYLLLHRRLYGALFCALWMSAIRYNDGPVFLMLLGLLIDLYKKRQLKEHRIFVLLALIVFAIAGGYIGYIMVFAKGSHSPFMGYGSRVPLIGLLWVPPTRRIINLFWGANWGLFWTGTFWLLVFVLGLMYVRRLSWMARGGLLWMLAGMLVCGNWSANGGGFAYRYLIGTYVGMLAVLLEVYPFLKDRWAGGFRYVGYAGAIWISYLVWVFKTRPSVTLWVYKGNWDNPTFLIEALKLFTDPVALIRPIALSPPVSIIYSWFLSDHPFFKKYVLSGERLYINTCFTLIALGFAAYILYVLIKGKGKKSEGMVNEQTS